MERHIGIRYGKLNLAATLHYPAGVYEEGEREESRFPAVVICHGFIGNRLGTDRIFVKSARELARHGYAVMRFDYAGCGESTGDYGAAGMSQFIEQTRYILDYVLELESVDPERVTLLGHSLGGAVAVLTAAEDKRVKSLVLWAPVGHPFQDIVNITGRDIYEEAVTEGTAEYKGYSLSRSFFESLSDAHPFQAARRVKGDVLLVHGTADREIPVDYSFLYQKVFRTRNGGEWQCEKEIVAQADHTFSSRGHSAHVIRTTLEWLENAKKQKDDWYGWNI